MDFEHVSAPLGSQAVARRSSSILLAISDRRSGLLAGALRSSMT
jgi:hypothetical protein